MTVFLKTSQAEHVSAKILDMRRKISDSSYVENAVQRIASVLSRKLVEQPCRCKEIVHELYKKRTQTKKRKTQMER